MKWPRIPREAVPRSSVGCPFLRPAWNFHQNCRKCWSLTVAKWDSNLNISKKTPFKRSLVRRIKNVREPVVPFQRKEQDELQLKARTPTVDKTAVEFLNPVNSGKKALKTVEIPMEDRLENLALTGDGLVSRMSQKNMAHLLLQSLHSKDAEMRSVFSLNESELIQRSAERFSTQYISVLLSEISTLMQQKTVHVATADCWLKDEDPQSHQPADGARIGEPAGQLEHLHGNHRIPRSACELVFQTERSTGAAGKSAGPHRTVDQESERIGKRPGAGVPRRRRIRRRFGAREGWSGW